MNLKSRVHFIVFKFLCVNYLAFSEKEKQLFRSTKLVHFNPKQKNTFTLAKLLKI